MPCIPLGLYSVHPISLFIALLLTAIQCRSVLHKLIRDVGRFCVLMYTLDSFSLFAGAQGVTKGKRTFGSHFDTDRGCMSHFSIKQPITDDEHFGKILKN